MTIVLYFRHGFYFLGGCSTVFEYVRELATMAAANPNIEAQNTEAKQHIAARKRPFPSTFGANVIVSEITHRES